MRSVTSATPVVVAVVVVVVVIVIVIMAMAVVVAVEIIVIVPAPTVALNLRPNPMAVHHIRYAQSKGIALKKLATSSPCRYAPSTIIKIMQQE